jgi:hypothetical protein
VEQARPSPTPLARLGLALAVGAAGAAGAAGALWPPLAGVDPDPVRFLVWLALIAPAAGYLAGALGAGLLYGSAAPGVWMVVLVWVDGMAERDLPTPFWAALGQAGLFLAGAGLGRWGRAAGRAPWAGAGVLLLLAALAVGLPGRGGIGSRPWPPAAARAMLDLSPATVLVESAGVDWMRHPLVYDPVGTDRFERAPYRGALAGPLALVVGCVLAAAGTFRDRRGRRRSEE